MNTINPQEELYDIFINVIERAHQKFGPCELDTINRKTAYEIKLYILTHIRKESLRYISELKRQALAETRALKRVGYDEKVIDKYIVGKRADAIYDVYNNDFKEQFKMLCTEYQDVI